MFQPSDWTIHLEYDDKKIEQAFGLPFRNDDLFLQTNWNSIHESEGAQFQLTIHPKQAIRIRKCTLRASLQSETVKTVFLNGYQSWSHSREFSPTEQLPRLRKIARPFFKYYGDEWIDGIPRGKGKMHSWTYTYLRQAKDQVLFLASLNERSCFTRFQFNWQAQSLDIALDLEDLQLQHSYPVFELFLFRGKSAEAYERWRNMMDLKESAPQNSWAWNSWYRHYQNINPELLEQDLQAIQKQESLPFEYFQIDDGFQKATGDWLQFKPEFKNQLSPLVGKIRKAGLKPGIWLAPFVCSKNSDLYKKHPEWLLKHPNGKAIKAGYNPGWGGWYYACDPFHPGFREYLTGVFHRMIRQYGFELIKLDFLFTAALAPPKGKTRGQAMHEAMEFLRQLAGNKVQLLACGVPLASAFRNADICRIGPDIHLSWDHKLLRLLRKRERVSTHLALETIIGRAGLNRHFFRNDPDVFILRKEGHQLDLKTQETLLQLNFLLGDVHFTSDEVSGYDANALEMINRWSHLQQASLLDARKTGDHKFIISYLLDGKESELQVEF